MTDLLLALAHHLLAFGLAALLTAETALLKPALDARQLRQLGRLDSLYGVFALLILIVGFARVYLGVRGPEFFLSNPWFWVKITTFVLVGILSAPPTVRFIAWRRKAAREPDFVLSDGDVRWVRRFFFAEIALFTLIPLFAAAMVRVPFL